MSVMLQLSTQSHIGSGAGYSPGAVSVAANPLPAERASAMANPAIVGGIHRDGYQVPSKRRRSETRGRNRPPPEQIPAPGNFYVEKQVPSQVEQKV